MNALTNQLIKYAEIPFKQGQTVRYVGKTVSEGELFKVKEYRIRDNTCLIVVTDLEGNYTGSPIFDRKSWKLP